MRVLLVLAMILGVSGIAEANSRKPIRMAEGESVVQQVVLNLAVRALKKSGFKIEVLAVAAPDLIGALAEGEVHAHPAAIAVELSGLPGAVEARTVRSLGGITANDPDEEMLKLVWPGMKKRWPDAQKMLKRMVIPADDLAAISDQLAGGEGADAVADAWWQANKKAWKPWIAASKNWMKP